MGLLVKGKQAVFMDFTAVVFDTLSQCVTEKEKMKFTPHPPEHQWLPCPGGTEPLSRRLKPMSWVAEMPSDGGGTW